MWKIWEPNTYYQVSCGSVCKRAKKSTRFVRLVLTGVGVANIFNIADFDLVFLHNTHIQAVILPSYLLVCFPFLSVCPVCLSVCLSLVLKVCMWEHLSIGTSVCLSSCRPVLLHCLSVFLFVCACLCISVRLYFCLSVWVFEHLSVCLPAFLPSCLSACLPSCLPACLSTCIPACLPTCHPPACLLACLDSCRKV